MRYKNREEIQKLIKQLLEDQEIHDTLVDHDFELSKGLRPRHIKQINKVLEQNKTSYRIVCCNYSLPYGQNKTYKTPYFVNTTNMEIEL